MQKQEGTYPRQTSAERKEALYDDIVTLFDKGKVGVAMWSVFHVIHCCPHSVPQLWECGIQQCKAIASQLETVTYNFEKLSEIHV